MTGNRRTPDHPSLRSDNLRPAALLKDSGFDLGTRAIPARAVVEDFFAKRQARALDHEFWTRVREEMRLVMADLEWAGTPLWERGEG